MYQMAYQQNKHQATIAHMTWQNYLEQIEHAGKSTSTQVQYPKRAFDLIHLDPWYDNANHPNARAMQKMRRLLDLVSTIGSTVIVWGNFRNLPDYALMLEGHYNQKATTTWVVDPSLAVVTRHVSRNKTAKRGVFFKSMTEHFLMATRVDPDNRASLHEGMVDRNHPSQVAEMSGYSRLDDPRLVEFSNIFFEIQPPTQAQRLRDLSGKPLRKMAEKGADINAQIISRFLSKGGSVYDVFGGSCSLALPMIARDASDTYFATENDDTVIEPAQNRLGKAFMLRDRHRSQLESSYSSLASFQTLASSLSAFVLPKSNVPSHLGSGKPLANSPFGNLDYPENRTNSEFEIKDTGMTVKDHPIGDGVFLCLGESDIPPGTTLPSLSFYGEFVVASFLDSMYPDGVPGYPGVFLLQKPFTQYALVIDYRCPAAKINDPRGSFLIPPCRVITYSARHRAHLQRGGHSGRISRNHVRHGHIIPPPVATDNRHHQSWKPIMVILW
jgi:16S rRNA G966 N2-methylase RsmD